jgi:hypothetical protein
MGGFLRQMMLVWSSLLPHNPYLQYMFIPLPCFSVFYISSKLLLHVIYISSVLSRILYLLSASPQSVFFPCFFMFIPLPCFSVFFFISSQLLLLVIFISSLLLHFLYLFHAFSLSISLHCILKMHLSYMIHHDLYLFHASPCSISLDCFLIRISSIYIYLVFLPMFYFFFLLL